MELESGTAVAVLFPQHVRYRVEGVVVVDRLGNRLEGRIVAATADAVELTTRRRGPKIQVEVDREDVQRLSEVRRVNDPSGDGALVGAGLGVGFLALIGGFGKSARDDAGLRGIMISTALLAGIFGAVGYLGDRKVRGTEERVIYQRPSGSPDEIERTWQP